MEAKLVRTPGYNYVFNPSNGRHIRWGHTAADNPQWSPIGPEILDIEVSTVCHRGCRFCYKGNVARGKNMSLETFRAILDRLPMLTQIAFGIGDLQANRDLVGMFTECRARGIVPNITINGEDFPPHWAGWLAGYCGAVAVSLYNEDTCYNAVERLSGAGLKQTNIHCLLSQETLPLARKAIEAATTDARLLGLNAIVFLSLKQRGRGVGYHPLSQAQYQEFMRLVTASAIRFGFDSCGAHKFLENIPDPEQYALYAEPCEATCFSSYINVEGKFFPCSFREEGDGLDVAGCQDFLEDVWYHPTTIAWRRNLLTNHRRCPFYTI